MELFKVRHSGTNEVVAGFNNKAEAKKVRNEKNRALVESGELNEDDPPMYVISLGKDHRTVKMREEMKNV